MSNEASEIPMAPRKAGTLRLALRGFVLTFALGFLCVGLFSLTVGVAVPGSVRLAMHLATSVETRSALAALVLGLLQAAISFGALFLLALVIEFGAAIGFFAAAFAAALPPLVQLLVAGPDAERVRPVFIAHLLCAAIGGCAGASAVKLARRGTIPSPRKLPGRP